MDYLFGGGERLCDFSGPIFNIADASISME
jgi:hypothetical protein